jgi:hypothetical protein
MARSFSKSLPHRVVSQRDLSLIQYSSLPNQDKEYIELDIQNAALKAT